jgi:hypothetical protein
MVRWDTHTHTHTHTHTNTRTRTQTDRHKRTHTHTHAHTNAHTHISYLYWLGVIRMLEAAASWPFSRLLASRHLESSLNAPATTRQARALLTRVCEHIAGPEDAQTVRNILAMRVRSAEKQHLAGVTRMLSAHQELWPLGLDHFISMEGAGSPTLTSNPGAPALLLLSCVLRAAPLGNTGTHTRTRTHAHIHIHTHTHTHTHTHIHTYTYIYTTHIHTHTHTHRHTHTHTYRSVVGSLLPHGAAPARRQT